MFRKLRFAFSAACGIVGLLLLVLWVRSCWWSDDVIGHVSDTKLVAFGSITGTLIFETSVWPALPPPYTDYVPWRVNSFAMEEEGHTWDASSTYHERRWRFQYVPQPNQELTAVIPHWFAVLLCAVLTASPWIHWAKRFSLRTLLIATTLAAVLLGAVVYALK